MSVEQILADARRWHRQAADDLEAARVLLAGAKFAQAGFYAQQAAEKALKAIWIAIDEEPWGHSAARLVRELPDEAAKAEFTADLDGALALDKLYIPTRYPDAFADLIPGDAYTQGEAQTAIDHAARIVSHTAKWLAAR